MTHSERLLWLASLDGTGKVLKFPTLREECPACRGDGFVPIVESHQEQGGVFGSLVVEMACRVCQGRGWVPVDTERALIQAILSAGYIISEMGLDTGDNQIYAELEKLTLGYPIVEGKGELPNEALVAALYEVEHDH